MRSLLDSNVLIALLDSKHASNENAHEWWATNAQHGWASCPLTENAVVRIMSNPGYDRLTRFPVSDIIEQLSELTSNTDHEFWPDEISLLNSAVFNSTEILGPKQLTDIYLLGLATINGGRLVTFDGRIPMSAVRGSEPKNMFVI